MTMPSRRAALLAVIAVLMLLPAGPRVSAQGGESESQPGTTIHIVQRDENLFRIAMRYGTTVEAISAANGISDPRTIAVGQRLLIPNAQADAPGALVTHIVQPGDTCLTLARQYQTTPAALASANGIINPALLYVGQELRIAQGAATDAPAAGDLFIRAAAGDNLLRIAARYGITLNALLEANNLTLPRPLFPGQPLWIPRPSPASPADLPAPFSAVRVLPVPPVQGQTVELQVSTGGPATITGTFLGRAVSFFSEEPTQHIALIGIDRFTTPGVYPLSLEAQTPDGARTAWTFRVQVSSGGYSAEYITLDAALQDLLNPDITEPEWQRVTAITSTLTPQRYFEGVMGLPSSGAITSQYGTQRTYNDGALNTFHNGTDFGGAPGTAVVAPAAGVVVLAEPLQVRGNATIIDHGWGVFTGYWHQAELYVKAGDHVTPGQFIGTVGSSGRVTGPHLHWELWVGGVQVDPMQWVRQRFP